VNCCAVSEKREDKLDKSKEKGKKKRSRFLARWFLLIPALFVLFAALVLTWGYESAEIWYREVRQERVLREKLASIREYNAELREELLSLETTAGVEDYARRELGLVFEGDQVIIVTRGGVPIQEPETTREATIRAIPENAQPFGAWTDFLDTLFGIE